MSDTAIFNCNMVVNKKPIGAHYGLKDWVIQRVSAIVMVISMLCMIISLCYYCPQGYAEWTAFINLAGIRILILLFMLSLVWHAFIGMRDIYMDYIKWNGLRLFKTVGIFIYLLFCLLWALVILL